MARNTYQRVTELISKPSHERQDYAIEIVMPWFRKKSKVFESIKKESLKDLIKNLEFVKKVRDDVLIRQGEIGDCMYILLEGRVTIYINYENKNDTEEEVKEEKPAPANLRKTESIRSQLGTFVTHLGAGSTFGEVALVNEDSVRNASVIVDEPSDLIVVDRELYFRSLKVIVHQEFKEKANFIAKHPYFQRWTPRYKRQLAMAFEKRTFHYETAIIKQGSPVVAMYFILSGEVKVTINPLQHRKDYKRLFDNNASNNVNRKISDDSSRSSDSLGDTTDYVHWRPSIDVCYAGTNEGLGEAEMLLKLGTYLQTAVCTRTTEVLMLETKHFLRLFTRRNPATVEFMKKSLRNRLRLRTDSNLEKKIPLFGILGNVIDESSKTSKSHSQFSRSLSTKSMMPAFRRIKTMLDEFEDTADGELTTRRTAENMVTTATEQRRQRLGVTWSFMHLGKTADEPPSEKSDAEDLELTKLEKRMNAWLNNEPYKNQPLRAVTLHRTNEDPSLLKQEEAFHVRLKPVHRTSSGFRFRNRNRNDGNNNSSAVTSQMRYFWSALNDNIPMMNSNVVTTDLQATGERENTIAT